MEHHLFSLDKSSINGPLFIAGKLPEDVYDPPPPDVLQIQDPHQVPHPRHSRQIWRANDQRSRAVSLYRRPKNHGPGLTGHQGFPDIFLELVHPWSWVFFLGVPPKWLVKIRRILGHISDRPWPRRQTGTVFWGASQLTTNGYLLYYIYSYICITLRCVMLRYIRYLFMYIYTYIYISIYIYVVLNLQYYIIYGDYTVISKPTMGVIP